MYNFSILKILCIKNYNLQYNKNITNVKTLMHFALNIKYSIENLYLMKRI